MIDLPALIAGLGALAYAVIFLVIVVDALPLAGFAVPGFFLLAGAAFAARAGTLDLAAVAAVAFVAALAGDAVAFAIGRRWGPGLLARLPARLHGGAERAGHGFGAHLGKSLVVAKFFSVTRCVAAPAAGAARVDPRRFMAWSALAVGVWVARALGLGWLAELGVHGGWTALGGIVALLGTSALVARSARRGLAA